MSCKIIVVGEVSSVLLKFALDNMFEIEVVQNEIQAIEQERGVIFTQLEKVIHRYPIKDCSTYDSNRYMNHSPTKAQRSEWRRQSKVIRK